jgi:hypothetical protein
MKQDKTDKTDRKKEERGRGSYNETIEGDLVELGTRRGLPDAPSLVLALFGRFRGLSAAGGRGYRLPLAPVRDGRLERMVSCRIRLSEWRAKEYPGFNSFLNKQQTASNSNDDNNTLYSRTLNN